MRVILEWGVSPPGTRWGIMNVGLETRDGTMIRSIIGFVLFISLTGLVYAQGSDKEMYSWTDENGVVHFSDQKPAGQQVNVHQIPDSGTSQSSTLPPGGEGPAANAAEEVDNRSPAQVKRDEMDKRRTDILAAREKNKTACAERRAEIADLEPNRRVFFTNEAGEVERMDDQVRVDRVAEAKAFVEANCQ